MSTTINFTTVTHAIASLSISGVTVKDSHELTDSIGLATAILAPRPDDFVTELNITPAELSQQNLDVTYTLNYVYYHCQIGGDLFSNYQGLLTNVALIVKAFANDATLNGAINNGWMTVTKLGPVYDAAGNAYHGAEFTLRVDQFLEV